MFKVPEQLKYIGQPVNAFEKRVEEAEWSVKDAASWAGNKLLNAGRAANRMLQPPGKPSKEDIERVRGDAAFLKEFQSKYNLTPIQAFNYSNGKAR
jgi:hypothetical protein